MMDPSGVYVGISSFEILHEGYINGGCERGNGGGGNQRVQAGKTVGRVIRVRGGGRDASYDILPPEVPDSASGSVPAGYCPAAWSRSSCRSMRWSMTGSTRRRSASSAAVMAQGPPRPAAGSGWDRAAAATPAAPPAPAEAARPRRRPGTAASSS